MPGDGMIDYDDIMKRLYDVGYAGGWLSKLNKIPQKPIRLNMRKLAIMLLQAFIKQAMN